MKPKFTTRDMEPREEFEEFRSALTIDRNTLDDDMLRQPILYHEVAEAHALAVSAKEAAKEELASIDANLALSQRTRWETDGKKFNETMIGDAVQANPDHLQAYRTYARYSARVSYLAALKESFEQRGRMLHELGALFIAGYFDRVTSTAGSRDVESARAARNRETMARLRKDQS